MGMILGVGRTLFVVVLVVVVLFLVLDLLEDFAVVLIEDFGVDLVEDFFVEDLRVVLLEDFMDDLTVVFGRVFVEVVVNFLVVVVAASTWEATAKTAATTVRGRIKLNDGVDWWSNLTIMGIRRSSLKFPKDVPEKNVCRRSVGNILLVPWNVCKESFHGMSWNASRQHSVFRMERRRLAIASANVVKLLNQQNFTYEVYLA
jgi:hypothetical protein